MAASAFLPGSAYLQLPRDPQRWIIKDLIPVSGLMNMYGKPKAGKSYGALGMAHAISSGASEWLEFPVLKHGPVAYLQIDTPRGEWADRIGSMETAGYNMGSVFICDMLMLGFYPFNVLDPEHFEWLKAQLDAIQPVVVFIDTIREAHNGDENDSTVMRNVVTNLVAASRPSAVVLLSHSRKDSMFSGQGGDDLMADARGSSYIAGRMDCVMKFSTDGHQATGIQYKGRGVGYGRIAVSQDDLGLIVLNPEETAYKALVEATVKEMRGADPKVSVSKMADAILTLTSYRGKSTIQKDIKALLGKG